MPLKKVKESDIEILFNSTESYVREIRELHESRCFDHEICEWRRLITSNGKYQVRRQCLRCGHVTGDARKHSPDDHLLQEVDPTLKERYTAQLERDAQEILQKHIQLQIKSGVLISYPNHKLHRGRRFVYDGSKAGKQHLDHILGIKPARSSPVYRQE